jgi:excisionase family DNA binding protein
MSQQVQPLSYSIPAAVAATGISRSRLYELAKEGTLKFTKIGKRTLIADEDLRALIQKFRVGDAHQNMGPKSAV